MLIKVENESLARDTNTGAILETDKTKINKYRLIKNSLKQKENIIEDLIERISKLEEKINNPK